MVSSRVRSQTASETDGGRRSRRPQPDGELAFVRDGDVVTPDGEIILDDLALIARRAFPRERPVFVLHVRQTAWLTDTRLVAVLRNPRGEVADIVMIFDDGSVVPGDYFPAGGSLYVSRRRRRSLSHTRAPGSRCTTGVVSPSPKSVDLPSPTSRRSPTPRTGAG
jgi:hypothetical protein